MTVPVALRWVLLALAGLLVAVAVAVLASKLTSQRIGLASEPLEAGQALAPAERRPGDPNGHPGSGGDGQTSSTTTATVPATSTSTATSTTSAPPPPSTTTGDDYGSDSSGEEASSGDD